MDVVDQLLKVLSVGDFRSLVDHVNQKYLAHTTQVL